MKKQLFALAAVLTLGGFASATAGAAVDLTPRSSVIHWATVVFCDGPNGEPESEVCVGGHTGQIVRGWIDATLSAVPTSTPMLYLAQ